MAAPYRKLGIIREGKVPADRRVPLSPAQCRSMLDHYPELDLVVQRSSARAFTDDEYSKAGITLVDDLQDRDLIMGIKEIPVEMLLADKSYLFFSHTIKEQPHNRKLLRAALDKGITLMDYELLTNEHGERVLAFGYWAGVVGAYNGFRAWQLIHGGPALKPAHECHDLEELEQHLHAFPLPEDLRIVLTGGGRVGKGAMGVLERAGVQRVSPKEFLDQTHMDRSIRPWGLRTCMNERTDNPSTRRLSMLTRRDIERNSNPSCNMHTCTWPVTSGTRAAPRS
jgi:saccharopine dehydrogenase (NAD+, L-lysine forming)